METRTSSPIDECLKMCGIAFCVYFAYRFGVRVGMQRPPKRDYCVKYGYNNDEDDDE